MPISARALLVALLLALVPLRALAAVTVGFCAMGTQESAAAAAPSPHGDAHGEHVPQGHEPVPCNVCVEHCSSASLAVAPELVLSPETFFALRPERGDSRHPGPPPGRIDRPPLAL